MSEQIKIGGRLHSIEEGNVTIGANEILDDTKGKKQNVINQETDAELERLENAKQDNLTFDTTPTEGSTNPITSGGVFAADAEIQQAIEAILLLIPSAASALNQLADKAFVNSTVATNTATFRGTYNVVTDLELHYDATHQQIATALLSKIQTADNNDYCFVQIPVSDSSGDIRVTERYKFNGTAWSYEYDLNNSGFTAAQWAAINSTITQALVEKLGALPTAAELAIALNGKQNTLTFDSTPTAGSSNPVTSAGLYAAFAAINATIPAGASADNKLVAETRLAEYVAAIINALDATYNVTSTDGHVNVRLTQVDGAITSLEVLTNDIASAADVTALTIRVSTNEGDIAQLQAAYEALTESDVVVVAPTDTWPVAAPQQNIIYRVTDRVNTPPQNYSDYMYNGTAMVLMATYNNAIDTRPKKGSQNLVSSGGVFDNMGALDVSELNATENPHALATYADLSAALATIPSDYQKGGMSVKFVCSYDNKYVQYRYIGTAVTGSPNPFLDTANWREDKEVLFINVNAVVGDFTALYTLSTAIAAIPSEKRRNGMFIAYRSGESNYEFAQYLKAGNTTDTNWLNTDNWKKVDDKSEIYSMLSTLNDNIDYLNAGNSFNSNLKTISPTPESGKYIDKDGNAAESNAYDKVTINLKRGEFFVGKYVASTNVSAIALVIDENTYKPIVIGEDGTSQKYYSYLATEQVSIVVSYRNSLSYLFYKTISEVTDFLTLNGTSKVNATSWVRSKYIDTHGQIQDNSAFSIGYLSLNKGDEIIVETEASTSICTIGLVDNSTITPIVFGTNGSIYCLYKYIAPDNINIAVCGRYSANGDHVINLYKNNAQDVVQLVEQANTGIESEVTKITNEVSPLVYDKSVSYNVIGGSYVDYTGTVQSGVSSYSMTSQIQVNAGETIIVKCSAGDGCATISIYDEETETYKVITRGTGSIACQNYTPVRDSKIVLSFRNTYEYYIYLSEKTANSEFIVESRYLKNIDYIKFVKKILFIGDSVTAGAVADYPRTTGTVAEDVPSLSYPVQFERITGVNCVNGGRSGYSAKDWYDNKINEYTYTDYNLCIIELGYNDGLEDTLDTDVIPYTDYRDYADSQCGNYCKIIGKIKEDNPNIMIVLIIPPGTTFVREEVPATVKHIANLFSLPYIDLRPNLLVNLNDNKYHGLVNGGNRDMIHFNPIGYMTKAVLVNKLLSQTLSDNLAALNNSVPIPSE